MEDAKHVHVDQRFEGGRIDRQDGTRGGNAGVGHHDVDTAESRDSLVYSGLHGLQIADVGDDWQALVRPRQTVVVYMGVGALGRICAELVAHGMPASMPAALVENATLARQRVTEGTLASLPELARAAKPPALLIVGEVVRLRSRLAWFGGKHVEVERDAARAD